VKFTGRIINRAVGKRIDGRFVKDIDEGSMRYHPNVRP
jgi:hypothetical protein